jgi:hypothetical protein
VLRWQASRHSSKVPLSADLKAKLVNVDERQVLIGEYPLTIKLPILLRLWVMAHLRDRSHQLAPNSEDFHVRMERRDRDARKTLLYCFIDDFAQSQSRIRRNNLHCLNFLLRGPFGFVVRVKVES